MKAWICWGIASVLAVLGLLVLPECVREALRISRLNHEGLRVVAEITRIEEESVSTTEDSVDQARYGTSKTVEEATLRYAVGGKEYGARHRLPEPIRRHRVGDKLLLLVLADEPARSYPTYEVTGDWIMSFMLPAILLIAAATLGGVGLLLREVPAPTRRQGHQK